MDEMATAKQERAEMVAYLASDFTRDQLWYFTSDTLARMCADLANANDDADLEVTHNPWRDGATTSENMEEGNR